MVVWALVLSILGICGVTAVVGIILGFVGRARAKEVGKGVGMATAAIIIGFAWLVLAAIGFAVGSGDTDTGSDTTVSEVETSDAEETAAEDEQTATPDEPEETAAEDEESVPERINYQTLGITIEELPSVWNETVNAYGLGNTLPDTIQGDTNVLGLADAFYDNDKGQYVSIFWIPETGEVTSLSVGGFASDASIATDVIANAATMVVATTDLGPAEAERFIVDDLIGTSIDDATPEAIFAEIIEEEDRTYRFDFAAGNIDFSIEGGIIE